MGASRQRFPPVFDFVRWMERLPHMTRALALWSVLVLLGTSWSPVGWADGLADETTRQRTIEQGIEYLRVRGQADDGSFSGQSGSAITGLCVSAILENRPQAINDPVVVDALAFLETQVRPDGGIYSAGSQHRNYETCVAVQAFDTANRDGRYDALLGKAEAF